VGNGVEVGTNVPVGAGVTVGAGAQAARKKVIEMAIKVRFIVSRFSVVSAFESNCISLGRRAVGLIPYWVRALP